MRKPIEKIIVIIIVIVLLPAIMFSVYEINSLNEHEKAIDTLYNNQLKSTLYSINKHSIDAVDGWIQRVSLLIAEQTRDKRLSKNQPLQKFININSNISLIVTGRHSKPPEIFFYLPDGYSLNSNFRNSIIDTINTHEKIIEKLLAVRQEGFASSGHLDLNLDNDEELIVFPISYTNDEQDFCGMVINSEMFMEKILEPELVIAAQKDFIINIINNKTGKKIYTTGSNGYSEIQQKQNLSLFPNYSIGIILKGQTISSLVEQRTNRTLILIILVDALLLIGLWYAVKNIKKEMELTKIKSDFIANVSHELRTPLSLISLFAETLVLGRASTSEKQKEYQKIILDETNRLSRIVNKILSFYEIEGHKKAYHFKPTDINSIAGKVVKTYSYQLENAGFNYCFKQCENIPLINGDEESLTEAVINLIDNSMKYSKDKKEIEIETGCDGDFVFIKISDRGIGISTQNINKIFDKFYRVQNGFVHETKGAGLGLSIVKSIVDAHNGEINVRSTEGEGTSFELIFNKIDPD